MYDRHNHDHHYDNHYHSSYRCAGGGGRNRRDSSPPPPPRDVVPDKVSTPAKPSTGKYFDVDAPQVVCMYVCMYVLLFMYTTVKSMYDYIAVDHTRYGCGILTVSFHLFILIFGDDVLSSPS